MKKILACALLGLLICAANAETPVTGGWADLAKISYGSDKNKVVIDDATYPNPVEKRKAFTSAVASGKTFVVLSGDVDLSDGKVSDDDHSYFDEFSSGGSRSHEDFIYAMTGNKTIVGTNNARVMFGGFRIEAGTKNLIIRNITFYDAHGSTEYNTKLEQYKEKKASCDALEIHYKEGGSISSGIWIDHCTFTDGKCVDLKRNYNHDGQLDIKAGKNITVSYCEFANHDKVSLIGSSDKYTTATERQITMHHNYYHNIIQRVPRSRGCQMHLYNNFYDEIGIPENTGSVFGPGIASQYVIENNLVGKTQGTVLKYYDSSAKESSSTFSKIYQSGNIPEIDETNTEYDKVDKTRNLKAHLSAEKVFKIKYDYKLEDAAGLKNTIPQTAGANKVKIVINGVEY